MFWRIAAIIALVLFGTAIAAKIPARSSTDRAAGFYPEDAGSIPAGPTMTFTQYEIIETYEATVTAYNSVPEQTDGEPCRAADGDDICERNGLGDKTCASNIFPFGQQLYIQGLGICTVRDRTSGKYAKRIDWYFGGRNELQAAKVFGKQRLQVKVLKPI